MSQAAAESSPFPFATGDSGGRGLKRSLSTGRIVFLVIAAAAPMAAMVGNLPLALALGNGPGLPGAFIIATATLLCFSLGYAAMSRRVVNTGAFYTYVAHGLGKPPAVAAALLAVLSYNALAIGLAGGFGYFTDLVMQALGLDLPWQLYAALGIAITAVLGYRSVDLSAKVLGVLMIAEVGILLVYDLAVVGHKGLAALPMTSLAPQTVFTGGLGIGLMFAFTCFIGFESAALYGEESTEPTRSIPRAIFISVSVIGVFYFLTTWLTVGALGPAAVPSKVDSTLGNLLFDLTTDYVAKPVSDLMGVLLCTSLLASMLAIHNAASRYMFALGREKLLPAALGRFHPRRYSPSVASLAQTAVTVCCVGAFALAGLDPYLNLATSMIGLSTLGIVALQAFAAIAIVVYFFRRPAENVWRTRVAPAIGAVGLIAATILLVANYRSLTGTNNTVINALPLVLAVAVLGGLGFAVWLRRYRPRTYAGLSAVELRRDNVRRASVVERYEHRYCIVGAGPSGLIMARALRAEGVPYDQFERHSDVGGIWDVDNPGSPMYDSAHFISSKYTSHFYGYPMPADYPDYPSHRQILAYIRAFATDHGLRDQITFNVGVEHAEPLGENGADGWRVRLSTGEVRHYAGLICANGVTWHPNIPTYPGLSEYRGEVRHTVTHRDAADLRGRRVLVVGAGNSGVDIACDSARCAEATFLSVRRGYRFVPKHVFGIPTDVFINEQIPPPDGVVVPDDPSKLIDSIVGDLTRYGLPAPDHDALTSHPIMNSQIIHHLAHGDVTAKPDVDRLTSTGAVFADGSEAEVDLVLFATGYQYRIPYLDESLMEWKSGRPQLYLNVFHRTQQSLYVLGFIEFADAAYQRFDEMAQMIVMDIHARETGEGASRLRELKAQHQPDLRGPMSYIDSPRHANYVETKTYRRVLAEIRDQFGWPDPDHRCYESLRACADDSPAPAAALTAKPGS